MAKISAADVAAWILCLLAAAFGAWGLHVGWNHSILDVHAWRQSHTAISAYEMARGGPFFQYRTPIFGPPWSWPLEFPLYQGLVAFISRWLSTGLEPTGRAVSVGFFVGTLASCWFALDLFDVARRHRPVFLALLAASPLYIFWSRTFMIESTALFVAVIYLVAVHQATRPGRARNAAAWLAASAVAGALAGPIKVTTFVPFLAGAALLVATRWRRVRPDRRTVVLVGVAAAFIPILATGAWLAFTDSVKVLNPLASELVWSGERAQRFGSLAQRFVLRSWYVVPANALLGRTRHAVVGSVAVFGCALVAAALRPRRFRQCLACAALYVLPLAVFMNLYLAHVYYSYENGLFLTAIVGCGIVACFESGGLRPWAGVALLAAALVAMSTNYLSGYYADQEAGRLAPMTLTRLVQTTTKADEVLLIYGMSYSPELPYESRHRAIMDWENHSVNEPGMQRLLAALGAERIGAIVVCGDARADSVVMRNIAHLGFPSPPWYREPYCDLYVVPHAAAAQQSNVR